MVRFCFLCLLLVCSTLPAHAETVVREWDFAKGPQGWVGSLVKNIHVEREALVFDTAPGNSLFFSPVFDPFPATPWQCIELKMQSDVSGPGRFFWTNTTQTQYQGFFPGKETGFLQTGGVMTTYRVYPFWQAEKRIIRLRLDFPGIGGHYLLKSLRVLDETPPEVTALPVRNVTLDREGGWRARVSLKAEDCAFITFRLRVRSGLDKDITGVLSFANNSGNGMYTVNFPLHADGLMHSYNINVAANKAWRDEIIALWLKPARQQGDDVEVESISVGREPQGPADLAVTYFGFGDAVARAGKPTRLIARVSNRGGETAQEVKPRVTLAGAKLIKEEPFPDAIDFGVPETFTWVIQADRPGPVKATLSMEGVPLVSSTLDFTSPLHLPKMAYVPEPKPAKSDYLVGAYYFPGWADASSWEPIKQFPERQPLLGWYREGDPEVADWQIKWAVEHGISFFLYDWYWNRGARYLEHGLHSAFFKAKYQNLIKFCLLYANHNGPGSHSAEDFEKVTRYWIENYFKRTNYLKVDNKPMVVFFAPLNPVQDMGAEKVKQSFDRMRALCREAGFNGLYLVACGDSDPKQLRLLKEVGYDAVSSYTWPGVNMTAEENAVHRSPYAKCIAGYKDMWESIAKPDIIKLIPPVSGGWDSRPWQSNDNLNRYGRNPELFKQHLYDCKRFLDEHEQDPKLKMLFIEAWNEWGEGSYIEPHREFGFGYLQAIREVFAPASPIPQEVIPADVGLGPYDLPDRPWVTEWRFDKEGDCLGWGGGNVADIRAEKGALRFTTLGRDPILSGPPVRVRAAQYPFFVIRLKASRDLDGQLFWVTATSGISEGNSLRFSVKGDGQFHETRILLTANSRWQGIITGLRFDPGSEDGVEVAIESIRLARE